MIDSTLAKDRVLKSRFARLTHEDRDYWSFVSSTQRRHNHGLFQYPAMTVPELPGAVMDQIIAVHPEINRILDPFVGSGTVLTESMVRGLSFIGNDVNPLAILLCRVKAGPFIIDELKEQSLKAIGRVIQDKRSSIDVDFVNIRKWFPHEAQIVLSRIRRAIIREEKICVRRFLWLGLAEAARLASNSRTSTFKLHIRSEENRENRNCDVLELFKKAIFRNLQHMNDQANYLEKSGFIRDGSYIRKIRLVLGDTRKLKQRLLSDVVITSPPYGDNSSTVPYGQYSYLPLQWVQLTDIDEEAGMEYLRSTHEIDARSLGGSRRGIKSKLDLLLDISPSFRKYMRLLHNEPNDRANRVIAFIGDLDACIKPILRQLRPGGLMVWIIGNRKVGGNRLPLDQILPELLARHDVAMVCRSSRRIPSKRMALKNNIADTMSRESILVMRKGN